MAKHPSSPLVSAGLARMDPHAEPHWISDHSHHLWATAEAAGAGTPPLVDRIAFAERALACWEQIAASQQRVSRPIRHGITLARCTLAELQEQATAGKHDIAATSSKA